MTMLVALPPRLRLRARVLVEPAGRMAWTRHGDRVIASGRVDGGTRGTVIVDGTTGGEVERWPHAYTAFACGFDDSWVAAANARGFVDLWRFGQPRPGEPTARHGGPIAAIVFSDDNRRIFTAGDDGRVGLWRAATLDATFVAVGGHAHDLAYDARTDTLAVAAGRSGVVLLDGGSGERRATVRPPDRATAVTWAEGQLFVGTRDGQLAAYDAEKLEPVRATAALGVGAIAQLAPLHAGVVVEGADAIAFVDGQSGEVRWRWANGVGVAGGSLAVHAGQSALAIAVPAAMSIVDVEPEPAPTVAAPELIALHHPGDAALAGVVVDELRARGGAVVVITDDTRKFVDVARRAATAIVFYGPSGAPLRHDYLLDVLEAKGVRVVPVILPGGKVPEAQRRFHGTAYVCFHERVRDPDALARVARAVLGS